MVCKHCGEEIVKVVNIQSGTAEWDLDSEGNYDQKIPFFQPDWEQDDFCCPSCLKPLFKTEEEAIEALNAKK